MQIIQHRINHSTELVNISQDLGIELDIRSCGMKLIIHHDPFEDGEDFEEWIKYYRHKTLILNVKEEGLEQRLLSIMEDKGIEDFFFLDQSFPFLVKTTKTGEKRCAIRVSEFESIDTAMTLAGKVAWVWVDCFSHFPLAQQQAKILQDAGFKLCLVSPELHGWADKAGVALFRKEVEEKGIKAEAVCTKYPEIWS